MFRTILVAILVLSGFFVKESSFAQIDPQLMKMQKELGIENPQESKNRPFYWALTEKFLQQAMTNDFSTGSGGEENKLRDAVVSGAVREELENIKEILEVWDESKKIVREGSLVDDHFEQIDRYYRSLERYSLNKTIQGWLTFTAGSTFIVADLAASHSIRFANLLPEIPVSAGVNINIHEIEARLQQLRTDPEVDLSYRPAEYYSLPEDLRVKYSRIEQVDRLSSELRRLVGSMEGSETVEQGWAKFWRVYADGLDISNVEIHSSRKASVYYHDFSDEFQSIVLESEAAFAKFSRSPQTYIQKNDPVFRRIMASHFFRSNDKTRDGLRNVYIELNKALSKRVGDFSARAGAYGVASKGIRSSSVWRLNLTKKVIKAGAAASFLVCGAVFIFDSSPEKPDHDSTVQAYDECFPDMKKVSLRDNLSNEELVQALTGLAVDQDKNNVKWILRAFEAKIAPEQIIQEYFNEKSQPRFLRGLASEKRILEIGYHYYEVLSIAYGPAIAEMLLGFQFTGITTEEQIIQTFGKQLLSSQWVFELANSTEHDFLKDSNWRENLFEAVKGSSEEIR